MGQSQPGNRGQLPQWFPRTWWGRRLALFVTLALFSFFVYLLIVSIAACEANCSSGDDLLWWAEAAAWVLFVVVPLAVLEFVVSAIRRLLRRLRGSAEAPTSR